MADITKGYTFGATEQVTAAKLHSLVDDATIASIVAADISDNAVTNIKIQSVSGSKFTNLSDTPAGAGVLPLANGGTGQTTLSGLLGLVYPVGSYYFNDSNSTNPATLLGFGTWTAVEEKVLVGYKSGSAEFGTAGGEGGVKTVTLTAAQSGVPAHAHTIVVSAGGGGSTGQVYPDTTGVEGDDSITASANVAANAAEAHTNIQPYRTVYMWRRTS